MHLPTKSINSRVNGYFVAVAYNEDAMQHLRKTWSVKHWLSKPLSLASYLLKNINTRANNVHTDCFTLKLLSLMDLSKT